MILAATPEDAYGVTFRTVIIAAGIIIFLFLLIIYLVSFRKMVLSERLFGFAVLMVMLYVGDGLREAIHVGLGFRVRLIFAVLGEAAFVAWLLEPAAARRARMNDSWIRRRSDRRN